MNFADCLHSVDNLAERLPRTAEAVALADTVSDPAALFHALQWRVQACMEVADVEPARTALERMVVLADDLAQPYMRWMARMLEAAFAVIAGDLARAEELATAALEAAMSSGQPEAMFTYGAQLLHIRFHQGRLAEVEPLFAEAVRANPGIPALEMALAQIYCELDRPDEAHALFDPVAASRFSTLPRDVTWVAGMAVAADVSARLADLEAAKILYEQLAPWHCTDFALSTMRTGLALPLAQLADLLGADDDADRHLAEAVEIHQRLRAPYLIAATDIERGARMLRRGMSTAGAVDLISGAHDLAVKYGYQALAGRAADLL